MKIKTMIASAVAALAISGALASVASAENGQVIHTHNGPIPAHTVQTPTGPMVIPDKLTEDHADGSGAIGVACGYASAAQASHYTRGELITDGFNWCFEEPGSIEVDQAKVNEFEAFMRHQS